MDAPSANAPASDASPRALGIRLIVAYKAVKAVAEFGLAVVLAIAAARGEIDALRRLAVHLESNVAGRWSVLAGHALAKLVSQRGVHLVELGLALDGVSSAFEGWSLWRGYWWGPWVVVVATGSPLPVEIVEIVRKPTVVRAVIALVNVLVVAYLARRIVHRRRERTQPLP